MLACTRYAEVNRTTYKMTNELENRHSLREKEGQWTLESGFIRFLIQNQNRLDMMTEFFHFLHQIYHI